MNLAALWALPVVFLCENNLYAVSTHQSDSMLAEHVSDRAPGYGMPGLTVDGNDPIEVYEAVRTAAERARAGDGPTLVECLTYRQGGHKRDDAATYRPREEVEAWLAQDPVTTFRARLGEGLRLAEEDLAGIEEEVRRRIDGSVRFAKASGFPAPESATEYVYG
jgi:TPP-dependent pyruvate/acetoin dehydrogenase alpha subunit